ncbi:MAG: arabinan endo-1,5-alpha-L-arabinosidase [Phycisphaerae bacterium]
MRIRTLILTTLLLPGSVVSLRAADTQPASQPAPAPAPWRRFQPPGAIVAEPLTHDPCMIKEGNTWYVYNTGRGIQAKSSTDLIHWKILPPVFDKAPAWAIDNFPNALYIWAPDISYFNHEYHLYYCISRFGRNRSVIAFASSPTHDPASPNNHWTDHGKVLESQTTDRYNAIDPAITLDADNTPWLAFGSFWDGIHLRRLSPTTGLPDPTDTKLYHLAQRPNVKSDPLEAPCIIHCNDYYYLMVSFDYCCRGINSTYHLVIGRSQKITGPYLDKSGTDMLQGGGTPLLEGDPHGRVRGPGGGIIMHDADRWLLVHHFYDANDHGIPKLQIRPITWTPDNWPIAGTPITDENK